MGKILLFVPILALLLVSLGAALLPFAFVLPPIEDPAEPRELADENSSFIRAAGVEVHAKVVAGDGGPYTFVLLHGFGSHAASWDYVLDSFAPFGTAVAFDRPGFGLTERPQRPTDAGWPDGRNPYAVESQFEIIDALVHRVAGTGGSGPRPGPLVLVGHSAGGSLALRYYQEHPERVAALILVSPAVYTGGGTPDFIRPLLETPQMLRIGPALVRQFFGDGGAAVLGSAYYDPSRLSDEMLEQYLEPTRIPGWERAFWEFVLASDTANLGPLVPSVSVPTLVITGDSDTIVPTADSVRLARELPDAELVVIENTGHSAQEEAPAQTIRAIESFVSDLASGRRR